VSRSLRELRELPELPELPEPEPEPEPAFPLSRGAPGLGLKRLPEKSGPFLLALAWMGSGRWAPGKR
jgi:hypothetical protein